MKNKDNINLNLKGKVILLMGFPGSGKGTQGKILESENFLNIPHLSTGELYRNEKSKGTKLGKKMQEYMNLGIPIPNELTFPYLEKEISSERYKNGLILDGYPKQIDHLEFLEDILKSQKKEILAVLYFSISKSEVTKRLHGRLFCSQCESNYHEVYLNSLKYGVCDECNISLSKRQDDTILAINNRLETFEKNIREIKEVYQNQGKLINIDAHQNIANITKNIMYSMSKFKN